MISKKELAIYAVSIGVGMALVDLISGDSSAEAAAKFTLTLGILAVGRIVLGQFVGLGKTKTPRGTEQDLPSQGANLEE